MSFTSLFEPTGQSVLTEATHWVVALLGNSLMTTIAVVIVGCSGALLLSGRFQIRRTAQTILGLFLLFGAADTANGLLGVVSSELSEEPISISVPELTRSTEKPQPSVIDPYAGPSLPMQQ